MRSYRSVLALTLIFLLVVSSVHLTAASIAAATTQYTMIDLGTLGGSQSKALAINSTGQAAGWAMLPYGYIIHASLWSNGTITDLGTFGGPNSVAYMINSTGQVVGDADTASGSQHAFFWANGTMTDLGTLGGQGSHAIALNSTGQVVGVAITATGSAHAFLWANGTMTDLGTLGGQGSEAAAINNTGQVVGWSDTASGTRHAFLWANGTMTDLGTFGGTDSYAIAINSTGQVVASARLASGGHYFLWSGGTATDLGTLGGTGVTNGGARINDAGQVSGDSWTAGDVESHAFFWSNGTMTDLGTLGGQGSHAIAINNSGQVVGSAENTILAHAFFWSNGTMTDLGTLGGWFSEAWAINDAGQVVGGADTTTANRYQHAFLASPAATPSPTPTPTSTPTPTPTPLVQEIDYFALGDSYAAGHGLDPNDFSDGIFDDAHLIDKCRQSDKAYPVKLRARLQQRFFNEGVYVRLHHFACSGATALLPNSNLEDPRKWLNNQVDEVLAVLSDPNRPRDRKAFVSVTIGIDDYPWTDEEALGDLFFSSAIPFLEYIGQHTTLVSAEVKQQMERILLKSPNAVIVVTEYPNPVNKESVLFSVLSVKSKLVPCIILGISCYDRVNIAIKALNKVLRENVVGQLAGNYPNRIVMTKGLYDAFNGATDLKKREESHVAPRYECGQAKPDIATTWIQYPSDTNSYSFPGQRIENLAKFSSVKDWKDWRGDCFHPNETGMDVYTKYTEAALFGK